MKCSIIRDLLPLYIDKVCSEDTNAAVKEHLDSCEDCRSLLDRMQCEMQFPKLSEEEQKNAKTPFAVLKRKKRNQIIAAVLATAVIMVSAVVVVDRVEFVNEMVFPVIVTYVEVKSEDEWQVVRFNYEEQVHSPYGKDKGDILEVPGYPFVLWKREIVNGVDNEGEVWIRLKNADGVVITDEINIHEGEGVIVEELEKGGAYFVEIKAEKAGVYRIAFH